MQNISGNLIEILSRMAFPKIGIIDIIQIALIAFLYTSLWYGLNILMRIHCLRVYWLFSSLFL